MGAYEVYFPYRCEHCMHLSVLVPMSLMIQLYLCVYLKLQLLLGIGGQWSHGRRV